MSNMPATLKSICAAFTFISYDTLLNITDEVEYIWKGQRSWIKWAYVFIRHMPHFLQGGMIVLFAHMYSPHLWSQEVCLAWWLYQAIMFEGLLIAVEGVFIVRIFAMYGHHRMLMAVILVLYFGEIAAMITLLTVSTMGLKFDRGCVIARIPPIFAAYWAVPLVFETFLFGLISIKFFTSVGRQLDKQPIFFVLVRDGMWAYAIIFVVMLLNTLMCNLLHNAYACTTISWEGSIISFAGSHVLLNIRRVSAERNSYVPSMWTAYGADAELLFCNEIPTAVSPNVEPIMDASQYELRDMQTDERISGHT
ncbi:hypothetical protein WOLCODRAFT_80876 [Wolfiporia cocos MD-104 SS10]|uniref:DUF6533 domain-containing protein n=1 Tax=Wolfiporia cocos (strain MD-104) TaxID=742152 RepID=A0A2H3JFR6_WOLCO|nr:hypothetical protein WOLCODRAFT_80876 [Wolfiporia cocos MD-104 SS10]